MPLRKPVIKSQAEFFNKFVSSDPNPASYQVSCGRSAISTVPGPDARLNSVAFVVRFNFLEDLCCKLSSVKFRDPRLFV